MAGNSSLKSNQTNVVLMREVTQAWLLEMENKQREIWDAESELFFSAKAYFVQKLEAHFPPLSRWSGMQSASTTHADTPEFSVLTSPNSAVPHGVYENSPHYITIRLQKLEKFPKHSHYTVCLSAFSTLQ